MTFLCPMRVTRRVSGLGSRPGGGRFLTVAGLVAALAGCLSPSSNREQPAIESAPDTSLIRLYDEQIRIAGITLGEVAVRPIEEQFQVSGRVTLNQDATVRAASLTEGMVVSCCESVGAEVKRGQVLARIYSHEVHDARASYRQAIAELQRRETELRFAEGFHRRAVRLHELKAGSLQDLQEAETKLRNAETSVEVARVDLERAGNHLRMLGVTPEPAAGTVDRQGDAARAAGEEADLVDVRSPASGVVVERTISSGAVVKPTDSLYVVSDLSTLWVMAQVPERLLPSLRTGIAVDVSVQAYPGQAFRARITQIADALDQETRTVEVRCELKNPARRIKTEMFATVTIPATTEGLVVPAAALQTIDGGEIVFVPEGAGAYRVRPIRSGRHFDSVIEVETGLSEGERVVATGAMHLKSELRKARRID